MTARRTAGDCGKTRYKSRSIAEKTRRRLEHLREEQLRVYGCPRCGGYHLTSQEPRWKRERREA